MSDTEYMRLSADQVGLFDHIKGAPRAVLNLPARIDMESDIDIDIAVKAMKYALTNLPFCTLRLHETAPDEFVQYYYDGEPEEVDIVDMSGNTDEDINKYVLERASSAFPNDYDDVQLYDVKFIKRRNGKFTLYFCGYHMVMDTVGVMYVITYYDKVYAAMTKGTELPAPGMPVEKYIEKSWEYKGSDKEKKDLEWWNENFSTEPHFADMNPNTYPEYIEGKRYGKQQTMLQIGAESMPLLIPRELVKKVDTDAENNNVTAMLYYGLALRTWLSLMSGQDDITIGTTGARRETLIRKHCGMTPAHMISWRSIIPQTETFRNAIHELGVSQKEMYRRISVDMADYMNVMNKKYNVPDDCMYQAIVFTYQAYFNIENSELKFSAEHVNVGLTPYPLYLNMMPHDATGDLYADYIYAIDYTDPENLKKFHKFMLSFVED